jgi:hypothetical protein
VLAAVSACPAPELPPAPIPPVSTGKVRVRVFTEPSPVRAVGAVGKIVFVATEDAVERWDDQGNVLAMSSDNGLPGMHIVAVAADADRKRLWILSDGGFGSYDTESKVYSEVTPPPPGLGVDYAAIAKEGGASVAPAVDNGAWLGTSHGLVYVSDRGGWAQTSIKDPVRALLRDRTGWLWIAQKAGLSARKPTGDIIKIGSAQGLDIAEPRLLVEAPGDRVLVIGGDDQGHERIAIGRQTTWTSYRTMPEITWDAATRRGNAIVVLGGGHVYRLASAGETTVRPLARDGLRLVPLAGGTANEWVIDPIDVVPPPGATALGSEDDELLIGTRDLGTARYRDGDASPHDWLRRKQMFESATTLAVACARADDCWVATGAPQAWHWTGERFVAGGPDQLVVAVARDPSGGIYAVHRAPLDKELHLSRIDGTTWTPVPKLAIAMPGDAPDVSFARFAAPGQLWLGLRYRDGHEQHAYGIAIVDTVTGKVTYHRNDVAASPDKKARMLPVPVGVVDGDVRGDTAWFATNEGVARLVGDRVKLWTEADGLRSELARAVTITENGGVVVATGAGAGVWDGKTWSFPAALRFDINDVVATRNGQVWMATDRGIAAWDGQKVRRIDARRGLAENQVLDVAADQFDRVWARGPGSLTLISQ